MVLMLSKSDVQRCITMKEAIKLQRTAFIASLASYMETSHQNARYKNSVMQTLERLQEKNSLEEYNSVKESVVPSRIILSVPEENGATLFKPAYFKHSSLDESNNMIGCKIVNSRPNNAKLNKTTITGFITLFDEINGDTLSIMDAGK